MKYCISLRAMLRRIIFTSLNFQIVSAALDSILHLAKQIEKMKLLNNFQLFCML